VKIAKKNRSAETKDCENKTGTFCFEPPVTVWIYLPIFSSNVYLIWLASLGPYVCEAH